MNKGMTAGMTAGIFGIGSALPTDVIGNAHLTEKLDTTDEWIVKRTGIRERHWLNGRQTLTDLAAEACVGALADAGRRAEDVDRIIVATMTPDRVTPGLASGVAELIGAERAGVWDVNAACAGFLAALEQGVALVESNRADLVLVCGADAMSRILDMEDRGTAVLFGDGAGAVVVARGELDLGVAAFDQGCDGTQADLLYAENDERLIRMQGRDVYKHAVRRMADSARAALERAGLEPGDLDLLVAHQANARIVEATAQELGIPRERVVLNLDRVANTSSASIPLALHDAEREGTLRPGHTVGLVAFGAGFVWAAGIVSWKERAPVYA
jgi:3-oxoacyl-[acyl-carrier-protein] synthase-3